MKGHRAVGFAFAVALALAIALALFLPGNASAQDTTPTPWTCSAGLCETPQPICTSGPVASPTWKFTPIGGLKTPTYDPNALVRLYNQSCSALNKPVPPCQSSNYGPGDEWCECFENDLGTPIPGQFPPTFTPAPRTSTPVVPTRTPDVSAKTAIITFDTDILPAGVSYSYDAPSFENGGGGRGNIIATGMAYDGGTVSITVLFASPVTVTSWSYGYYIPTDGITHNVYINGAIYNGFSHGGFNSWSVRAVANQTIPNVTSMKIETIWDWNPAYYTGGGTNDYGIGFYGDPNLTLPTPTPTPTVTPTPACIPGGAGGGTSGETQFTPPAPVCHNAECKDCYDLIPPFSIDLPAFTIPLTAISFPGFLLEMELVQLCVTWIGFKMSLFGFDVANFLSAIVGIIGVAQIVSTFRRG